MSATSEFDPGVPYAILLATMLQASRLLARREDAQGSLTVKEVDDVRYQWGNPSTELDRRSRRVRRMLVGSTPAQGLSEKRGVIHREGHFGPEGESCTYCDGRVCGLCASGLVSCSCCDAPICRRCVRKPYADLWLCPACATMRAPTRSEARQHGRLLLTRGMLVGTDNQHVVVVEQAKHRWTRQGEDGEKARNRKPLGFQISGGAPGRSSTTPAEKSTRETQPHWPTTGSDIAYPTSTMVVDNHGEIRSAAWPMRGVGGESSRPCAGTAVCASSDPLGKRNGMGRGPAQS